MNDRNFTGIPVVTPGMFKGVSQWRQERLAEQVERGQFHANGFTREGDVPEAYLGNVVGSSRLTKMGSVHDATGVLGNSGRGFQGAGDTVVQTPEFYSPLWLNSNLNLPRDRATINAWNRAYFALNPFVQNALMLHSTYPISKLNIRCKDPKIEQFFADMIEELDLMNVAVDIAMEYWSLGEAFVYAELDSSAAKWSRIILQNPDYITVKKSVVSAQPVISLRPDENLRRIVFSNRPSDVYQRQQLDPMIVENIKKGQNIPLSNFNVTHIARRLSPYEIRGTSLTVSIFRQLMLYDRLRESKYAQADSMINPLTIFKIGSQEFRPSPDVLERYRQTIEESQSNKDFKLFTHQDFDVQVVGRGQGIYDISGDITQLVKEIYIGLMVPQVIMDGGGDVTYSNGGITLDVLRQRYMQFRNMLSSFLRNKIFAPIARLNEFYETVNGEYRLVIPDIDWNHMSLFDMNDYVQTLMTLVQAQPKLVSEHTLYRSLGLDWEDEQSKIKEESISRAIVAREEKIMSQMPLNELRSLGPDHEIIEPPESPVPGEVSSEQPAQPGGEGEAGGAGGALPGGPPAGGGGGGGLI